MTLREVIAYVEANATTDEDAMIITDYIAWAVMRTPELRARILKAAWPDHQHEIVEAILEHKRDGE